MSVIMTQESIDSTALTSSEAASLLAVHPSTVKRWCNEGELPSDLTQGGHRRIRVDAAASFARDRGIRTVLTPFHPFEPQVWSALQAVRNADDYGPLKALALGWARRGEFERLEQLYLALGRYEEIHFCAFTDRAIRGLLTAVGEEWESGRLRVGDEHMVSQAMLGALATLRREWFDTRAGDGRTGRPVAVVGTVEGNRHHLASYCVRILLERLGWDVYYPGPDVPIEDFGVIQASREASLVCVSLPPGGTIGDVVRCLAVLQGFYDRERPYALAFGGASSPIPVEALPTHRFETVAFFDRCSELREAVARGFGAPQKTP
jgi:excisionase family DNA binding protein